MHTAQHLQQLYIMIFLYFCNHSCLFSTDLSEIQLYIIQAYPQLRKLVEGANSFDPYMQNIHRTSIVCIVKPQVIPVLQKLFPTPHNY